MQRVEIKTRVGPAGPIVVATGEFDDDEYDLLVAYAREIERLRSSRVLASDLSAKFKIVWNNQSGNFTRRVESKAPDDDDVAILLHRLRPFILDKERTSFGRVSRVIAHRFDSTDVRYVIAALQREFSDRTRSKSLTIRVAGQVVNDDRMFSAWLNTFEYHRDVREKLDHYSLLDSLGTEPELRGMFAMMLVSRLNAVLRLGEMVSGLLRVEPLLITLERSASAPQMPSSTVEEASDVDAKA